VIYSVPSYSVLSCDPVLSCIVRLSGRPVVREMHCPDVFECSRYGMLHGGTGGSGACTGGTVEPGQLSLYMVSLSLYIVGRVYLPRISAAGVCLPPDVATGKPGVFALLYRESVHGRMWECLPRMVARECLICLQCFYSNKLEQFRTFGSLRH